MTPLTRLTRVLLLLACTCLATAACLLAPHQRPDLAALSLALAGGFAAALLRELSRENGDHGPPSDGKPPPGDSTPDPRSWPDVPGIPRPPRAYWGDERTPGDSTPPEGPR